MPNCLFDHLFKQSLNRAVINLKEVCRKDKTSEHQKGFNIDNQIPIMSDVLKDINNLNPDDLSLNWPEYRTSLVTILEETKNKIATQQTEKQGSCGSTISVEHTTAFCNKILRMFDEMRTEITASLFAPHGNKAASLYINTDYSKSSHLNQLINIALEYRFNKVQGKIVADVVDYTDKHKAKWLILTESIELWLHKLSDRSEVQQRLMKRDITGLLNQLIKNEGGIQNEVKPPSQQTVFSYFKSCVKSGLTLLFEEETSLRPLLQALSDSYLSTSSYAATYEHNLDSSQEESKLAI